MSTIHIGTRFCVCESGLLGSWWCGHSKLLSVLSVLVVSVVCRIYSCWVVIGVADQSCCMY